MLHTSDRAGTSATEATHFIVLLQPLGLPCTALQQAAATAASIPYLALLPSATLQA
jgi:hypothetical protein